MRHALSRAGQTYKLGRSQTGVRRVRQLQVCAVFQNPYKVLGIPETADVQEVKKAYRKLALLHHPDVSKSTDAEYKFLCITEAYDILMGKARGKEIQEGGTNCGDWDFHDWYWSFRLKRSWEKQQQHGHVGATSQQAGYRTEEGRNYLRTQLAGLRHRAAVRANRPKHAPSNPCSATTSSDRETTTTTMTNTKQQTCVEDHSYPASEAACSQQADIPSMCTNQHSPSSNEPSTAGHAPAQHSHDEAETEASVEEDATCGAFKAFNYKRRFVGGTQTACNNIVTQLAGLKRKSMLKQQSNSVA